MRLLLIVFFFLINFTLLLSLDEGIKVLPVFTAVILLLILVDIPFKKLGPRKTFFPVVLSYNIIAFIGIFYAYGYHFNYGEYHGPFGDDSFFLSEATALANGTLKLTAPFESALALVIRALEYLDIFNHLSVLVIYWIIPALFVSLINHYVRLYTGSRMTPRDICFFILFNYLFIDIFVHLYRDSLIYLVSIVFLIGYKKRINFFYLIALIFIVFFLRGGNALLLLSFVGIDRLFLLMNKKDTSLFKKGTNLFKRRIILLCLIFTVLILGLDNFLLKHISRFDIDHGASVSSVVDYAANRQQNFFEVVDQGQLTVQIYELGVIGYPLRLVSQILSPITFRDWSVHNFRVSNKFNVIHLSEYLDFTWIFYSLTIFLWIYVLPRLLIGLKRMLQNKNYHSILAIFIISLVLVAFVSLQARHRVMFFMYYPLIVGVFNKEKMDLKEIKLFSTIKRLTIVFVILSLTKWIIF